MQNGPEPPPESPQAARQDQEMFPNRPETWPLEGKRALFLKAV